MHFVFSLNYRLSLYLYLSFSFSFRIFYWLSISHWFIQAKKFLIGLSLRSIFCFSKQWCLDLASKNCLLCLRTPNKPLHPKIQEKSKFRIIRDSKNISKRANLIFANSPINIYILNHILIYTQICSYIFMFILHIYTHEKQLIFLLYLYISCLTSVGCWMLYVFIYFFNLLISGLILYTCCYHLRLILCSLLFGTA